MSTKRWPLRCPAQCSPLHLHLSYRVTPLGIRTRGTRVSWRSACWLKWIHVGKKHETWRMCWCRCATGAFKGAKEELCPVAQVTIFPQAGRAFPRVFLSIEHHFFYYKGLSILVLLFPALVFFFTLFSVLFPILSYFLSSLLFISVLFSSVSFSLKIALRTIITIFRRNSAFLDKGSVLKSYINVCPEMLALSCKKCK